jgi:TonB family protein
MGDAGVAAWTAQPRVLVIVLLQAVVGFACFAAIVGLRFVRRGATRFWIGPALVALCLVPGVVAAGLAALAFRDVLSGIALVGTGGAAALAAGAAESLSPLLVGLAVMCALSLLALVVVAAGTGRVDEAAPASGTRWAPFVAPLALVLGFGPVAGALGLVNHGGFGGVEPARLVLWWRLVAACALLAAVALVAFAVATAWRAPRIRAPLTAKLLPPLCLLVVALFAASTWIFTLSSVARLSARAIQEKTAVASVDEPSTDASPQIETAPEEMASPEPEPEPEPEREATPTPRRTRPRPVATRAAREPEAPRAVRVGGTIAEPRKLKNVSPFYSAIAKQARVQGVVILECTIGVDGRVTDVKVLRSIPLLDDAAVEAVRQWVYTPTLLNGVPVPVIMTVTVNFKLS